MRAISRMSMAPEGASSPAFRAGLFSSRTTLQMHAHSLTPRVIQHLSLYLWEEVATIFKKKGDAEPLGAHPSGSLRYAGYFDRLRGTSHGVATLCLPSLR